MFGSIMIENHDGQFLNTIPVFVVSFQYPFFPLSILLAL